MATRVKKAAAVAVDPRTGLPVENEAGLTVEIDSRICFGIAYYRSEEAAAFASAAVAARGDTYNGGWFHGMSCGRDTRWDYVSPEHGPLFAVTTR